MPVQQPGHAAPPGATRAGSQQSAYAPPPIPPAPPTDRLAAQPQEPDAGKKKRSRLRDPLAIVLILIIVLSLVVAGLIGAELYVRKTATDKIATAAACESQDKATAHFGVAPLVLWQIATQHFTNISVETAGNQFRNAIGMKLQVNIQHVALQDTANSKGTIGSIDATVTWTSDGIKQSIQNKLSTLGQFVTNSVTTHPNDGTVELKGTLDDIVAKPVVSGGGIQLQIVSFNALGFKLPKESVQSTLDNYTSSATQNLPLGIHADSVQVTATGVVVHLSSQNATIPAGGTQDPCFANL
jgi:hypothetical protein